MRAQKPRPRPLDEERLNEMALAYAGKYATTRRKFAAYLKRKLRERGWEGDGDPEARIEAIVSRFAEAGYVDDAAYALARSRSLTTRGYGAARVRQSLAAAGVEESDSSAARELAEQASVQAALRFARRRRIGPYAAVTPPPDRRQKALSAMVRAGHSFALAKAIIDLEPGSDPDDTDLELR